jgi:2-(1,2-epoxy-1,2-dihydrophenyl)acetyl-CoA isomerase
VSGQQAGVDAPVLVRREGAVAYLTLNRPDSANTIDAPLALAFREVVAQLDADASVRALVIEGAGRMFCAGGDLVCFANQGDGASRYVEALIADLHAGLEQLVRFHAPVIAAVKGAAAGAGLGLALATDIVIAEADSQFVMAYTRAGLTHDGGTSWALPRAVGMRQALALTLMNRVLTADEALDCGLVTEVTPKGGLQDRVRALAEEFATGPTTAFAAARRLLRASTSASYASHLGDEARSIVDSFATPDGLEGVRAFTERRQASFQGL